MSTFSPTSHKNSSRSKSAQEKAEQLLQLADAVEKASHQRKLQLEEIQSRLADDDDDNDDEEENEIFEVSLNDSLERHHEKEQQPSTKASSETGSSDMTMTLNSESGRLPVTSHERYHSTRSLTKSKQSKRKLIKELKEQLSSSHRALVTVQENAQLKLQKALMEKKDVEDQLQMKQDELKRSKETIRHLQQQVSKLEMQLTSALGTDRVEWLIELETSNCRLLGDVDRLSDEKSAVSKERDELNAIVQKCETCKTKVSTYVPPEEPKAPQQQQQSFWSGAKALFHLNELHLNDEAEATPAGVVVVSSTAAAASPQQRKKKAPVPRQQPPKTTAPRSSFLGALTSRLSNESSTASTPQTSVATSHQKLSKANDQEVNELRLALEQDVVSTRNNSGEGRRINQRLQSNGSFRKTGPSRGSLDKIQHLRDSFRGSLRMLETEELHDDADNIEKKVAKQIQSGAGVNLLPKSASQNNERQQVEEINLQDVKQRG